MQLFAGSIGGRDLPKLCPFAHTIFSAKYSLLPWPGFCQSFALLIIRFPMETGHLQVDGILPKLCPFAHTIFNGNVF